jgi:hypothetical protein
MGLRPSDSGDALQPVSGSEGAVTDFQQMQDRGV